MWRGVECVVCGALSRAPRDLEQDDNLVDQGRLAWLRPAVMEDPWWSFGLCLRVHSRTNCGAYAPFFETQIV